MDLTTLVFGCSGTAFGVITIVLRVVRPQWFKKYQPMKERYGDLAGSAIHIVGYSLLPLFFGVFCLFLAVNGQSIMSR